MLGTVDRHGSGLRDISEAATSFTSRLVPTAAMEAMVVMMAMSKSQDHAGATIVARPVVAVATPTVDRPAATQMTVPPAAVRTPAAAPVIAVYFGNQPLLGNRLSTHTGQGCGLR